MLVPKPSAGELLLLPRRTSSEELLLLLLEADPFLFLEKVERVASGELLLLLEVSLLFDNLGIVSCVESLLSLE